jgi:hypothetical protein
MYTPGNNTTRAALRQLTIRNRWHYGLAYRPETDF